jgi:hypothetical protein
MLRPLDFIEKSDGQVSDGNLRGRASVHQQLILTDLIMAGT